jgi:amino acid permease
MDRNLLGTPRQFPGSAEGEIRARYLSRIGLYSYKVNSYVPNLVPLFTDSGTSEDIRLIRERSQGFHATDVVVSTDPLHLGTGSIESSILNLTTATLGVGTLAIPYAFYNSGILVALILLLFLAWLSVSSIKEIISSLNATEKHSFEEVTCMLFGRKWTILFEICILTFCFGTAVGYHVTIADIGLSVTERYLINFRDNSLVSFFLLSRSGFLVTITSAVLLPLSLFDKVAELRYTCFLGVGCVIGMVIIVASRLFIDGVSPDIMDNWIYALLPRGAWEATSSMGILTFAFCSQPNVPTIFYELGDRTIAGMTKAVNGSVVLCLIIYTLIGLSGFLQFGANTASSVILNLQPDFFEGRMVVVFAYALMAFAVCMSFPLNIFPIKLTFEQLFIEFGIRNINAAVRVVVVTSVILSLGCAVFIPKVSTIFDLIGNTVGSLICFVFPPVLYIKILSLGAPLFCRRSLKAWIVLLVGCALLCVGLSTSLGFI